MKLTFNWLKEFVAFADAPERLAELLTMAGLEVESLTPLSEPDTGNPDWLFEISVTPNRGDCLGIIGIAREVAAHTGAALRSPTANLPGDDGAIGSRIGLSIEDPHLCARYSARIVDEVRVGSSPAWLRFRIEACGIRAINSIVDVTNYVMLETGQPLHAFDLDRLKARKITVKTVTASNKFTTLDGVERELVAGDLVICDGDTPVALAGVMGGLDSQVRGSTRTVLLESAHFAPAAIRRTAKRLALHSEASHRFERSVDPEGTVAALNRAAHLLSEVANGRSAPGVADLYARVVNAPSIALREERIAKLLGLPIDLKRAEHLLSSLGMKIETGDKAGSMKVIPPSSRPDLCREADLIEELARLQGYDRIPTSLPLLRLGGGKPDYRLGWERKCRAFFSGEGLHEVINLPFVSEQLNGIFPGLSAERPQAVLVLNPLAKENAEMRRSLLPGLIENLRLNMAQKSRSFFGYHLGKVFSPGSNGIPVERQWISAVLHGPRPRQGLRLAEESSQGFLPCKGLLEGLFDLFHLRDAMTWSVPCMPFLHPGRSALVCRGEDQIAYLGQLHPDLCDRLELPPVLLFELDFEKLLEYAPRQLTIRALPRFPSVERDVAMVVKGDFAAQRIVDWIQNLGVTLIEHVAVFDQYMGAPIPEGKKSLAYKVSYRAEDRTLTDSEINDVHQGLVEKLTKTFAGELRS